MVHSQLAGRSEYILHSPCDYRLLHDYTCGAVEASPPALRTVVIFAEPQERVTCNARAAVIPLCEEVQHLRALIFEYSKEEVFLCARDRRVVTDSFADIQYSNSKYQFARSCSRCWDGVPQLREQKLKLGRDLFRSLGVR